MSNSGVTEIADRRVERSHQLTEKPAHVPSRVFTCLRFGVQRLSYQNLFFFFFVPVVAVFEDGVCTPQRRRRLPALAGTIRRISQDLTLSF